MGRILDAQKSGTTSTTTAPVGRVLTYKSTLPPTFGEKAATIGKEVVKAIAEPVLTMVARPFQLGAELLGASDESVNEFTKRHFGDWIAPTPQNVGDVYKDVGRGVQTALTAGLGGTLKGVLIGKTAIKTAMKVGAIEGAGFGLGASMEQGNDILSKETAKNIALGAALGITVPVVIKGVGRVLKGKGAGTTGKTIQEVTRETPIQTGVETPVIRNEIIPPGETAKIIQTPIREQTNFINNAVQKLDKNIPENATEAERIYQNTTNAKQIEEVMTHDFAFQKDVALGRKPAPVGGAPATAYRAYLENIADGLADKGDPSLALELAKTKIVKSEAGASLQATQIASKESLTDILSDVREQMISKIPQSAKQEQKIYNDLTNALRQIPKDVKPSRPVLVEILEKIKCK